MLIEAHIAKPMPNASPMGLGDVIRAREHPEARIEGDAVVWTCGGFEYAARWVAVKRAPEEKKPDAPPPSPEPEAKPADDPGRSAKGPGRGRAKGRRAP